MSAERTPRVSVAAGAHGAVAAGHPAAAAAALDVLRTGGNAVEAAIAGSAVQCVVEMPWCGVGGDAFAMIRTASGETLAFNGSGCAPTSILDAMGGRAQVPRHGVLSVGVPGVVDAWAQLAERFATRSLGDLLTPAVRAAADGIEVDDRLRHALASLEGEGGDAELHRGLVAELHHGCLHLPELAATLQAVVDHGRNGFYEGATASRIARHVQASGGAMSAADLAAHRGSWSAPLAVPFRGTVVHVQPPVSMGVLLLVALRLAERMAPEGMTADLVRRTDLLVGVKHTVFRRALTNLGDPAFVPDRALELLSDAWIEESLFAEPSVAAVPGGGGDTTSIAVTDASGTTISLIHSLFNEFGSRVLVPGTGVVLNDRLANLRTAPGPANVLAGGKRPMHTLHSWVADLGDGRVMSGATPGGRGQVQTNLQVLLGVVDDRLGLAEAVDRPRWVNGLPRRAPDDDTLFVEWDFDATAATELSRLGHRVETASRDADDHFGACTVVERTPTSCGAVGDHRRNCAAMAW